jgi:small subunit ribosomal protein S8
MNDPIIDLIISIKNGYMSRKDAIVVNHSKYKLVVAEKLKSLGYVDEVSVEGENIKKITVSLSYKEGVPALTGVQLHSKPGTRMYTTYRKLKPVLGGAGFSFISTSKGIMTDKESIKNRLGGELLFSIW